MRLEDLKREDVSTVLSIADRSVGKNLYSYDDFLSVFDDEKKFLYVLKDDFGVIAGYIYFLITSSRDIEESLGLEAGTLPSSSRLGRIQSVALEEAYRGKGLGEKMIDAANEAFSNLGINTVLIVCWKPGGVLPLSNALKDCSFDYLMTVKEAWYRDENLYCPHCHGRCHCDAEIYYKNLFKEKI